jgi:hypothetical protein
MMLGGQKKKMVTRSKCLLKKFITIPRSTSNKVIESIFGDFHEYFLSISNVSDYKLVNKEMRWNLDQEHVSRLTNSLKRVTFCPGLRSLLWIMYGSKCSEHKVMMTSCHLSASHQIQVDLSQLMKVRKRREFKVKVKALKKELRYLRS